MHVSLKNCIYHRQLFSLNSRLLWLCLISLFQCQGFLLYAQSLYEAKVEYDGVKWTFPYAVDHVSFSDFSEDNSQLLFHRIDDESIVIPFDLIADGKTGSKLDELTFSDGLAEGSKDKYKVFALYVTTDDHQGVPYNIYNPQDKQYTRCYVSVDGRGEYPGFSGSAQIRGRGNSTWQWYDKKPFRLKLDVSSKMLGVKKNRDWVLLANYRDVTKMMNTFCFKAAEYLGLSFTSPVRYAELFIDGQYWGVYQIAEQVEVGNHRVDIDEEEGVLLSLDKDDGPELSPNADDNFWSEVYRMPVCVKSPKNLTKEKLDQVKADLAVLERAIKAQDYDLVETLLDIPSTIAMLQLQEYVFNVELEAPRSVFLYRDKGGKYTFGPAWDWDAGFDFRWSDMYTGHTYFTSYTKTLMGTNPYKRNGNNNIPRFFTDLFANSRFVQQYKEQWRAKASDLFTANWAETQKYIDGLNELQKVPTATGGTRYTTPQLREDARWPIKNFSSVTETKKLKEWLQNRLAFLNEVVENYPDGTDETPAEVTVVGTIEKSYELQYQNGYSQNVTIQIDKNEVASLLGVEASYLTPSHLSLIPLNADGSEGENTAAKTYGAWFDADGNTNSWPMGHVYIESDNLFSWACGCHPDNCWYGESHTVTMQYVCTVSGVKKGVNVIVHFDMAEWSWW